MIVPCVYVKLITEKCHFITITCRDSSKYNHAILARDIENYNWKSVYTEANVNITLNYMEQGLTAIINRYAP